MKSACCLIAALFLSLAGTTSAGDGKHLFILSGQSNMAGLDPAVSFTPTVGKAFGADAVLVIKDAQGGLPIRRWYKNWKPAQGAVAKSKEANGDLYDRLMGKVKPAIAGQKLESVTFVWMQGERDAKESHGEVYAESLKGLVAQLRQDLGREDIHVVIGRLSDCDMKNNKQPPHWTMVREAQVKVAGELPSAAWVDTDDLNGPNDGLHYSKQGYEELGKRFAEKAIALIQKAQK